MDNKDKLIEDLKWEIHMLQIQNRSFKTAIISLKKKLGRLHKHKNKILDQLKKTKYPHQELQIQKMAALAEEIINKSKSYIVTGPLLDVPPGSSYALDENGKPIILPRVK